MNSDFIDNLITEISPRDFEILIKDYLLEIGKELKSFTAKHDENISRIDGEYQIDIFAVFNFLGVDFRILVECKKHKNKIKRGVVQLLFDKLRATGSQKGIIFSTAGFQEGAIKFAREHGIALIHLIEGKYTYETKSIKKNNFEIPEWMDIPKYVGLFKYSENGTAYLQKKYLDKLESFIFKENEN